MCQHCEPPLTPVRRTGRRRRFCLGVHVDIEASAGLQLVDVELCPEGAVPVRRPQRSGCRQPFTQTTADSRRLELSKFHPYKNARKRRHLSCPNVLSCRRTAWVCRETRAVLPGDPRGLHFICNGPTVSRVGSFDEIFFYRCRGSRLRLSEFGIFFPAHSLSGECANARNAAARNAGRRSRASRTAQTYSCSDLAPRRIVRSVFAHLPCQCCSAACLGEGLGGMSAAARGPLARALGRT